MNMPTSFFNKLEFLALALAAASHFPAAETMPPDKLSGADNQ